MPTFSTIVLTKVAVFLPTVPTFPTIARNVAVFLPTVRTVPTFPTIGRSFLAYGANVSNDSTKVLPTVPTFPTIARRSQFTCLGAVSNDSSKVFSRSLLAYAAVSNDSSKVGMHTTRTDNNSRTWGTLRRLLTVNADNVWPVVCTAIVRVANKTLGLPTFTYEFVGVFCN